MVAVAALSWESLIRLGSRIALIALLKPLVMWILAVMGVLAGPEDTFENSYRLGPGDTIQITVNDEPDLTLKTKIALNGKISFFFLGEINVAGQTVKALEKHLHDKLLDGFLLHPVVFVSVVEHRIYFVNGEVNRAGGYPFLANLTVRKAVVLAGGFSDHADRSRITVIRGNDPLYQQKRIKLDAPVLPGDIITVAESFW